MLRRLLRLFPSETITGYEHPELVDVVFRKTLAYKPEGSWPEIEGARTVLDFGGGCGAHYKEANSPTVRWAVVETPAMAARASELATDKLKFFSDIPIAAAWLGDIDVMHSSGALFYAPDPLAKLRELVELDAPKMLWRRMHFTGEENQVSRLADNGPGRLDGIENKNIVYRAQRLPEEVFLSEHRGYQLAERGPDWFCFLK